MRLATISLLIAILPSQGAAFVAPRAAVVRVWAGVILER